MAESVKQQSASLLELGQQLGLQGASYWATDEAQLWQKLQAQMSADTGEPVITCKIGVLPSAAVATLNQLDAIAPQSGISLIHSGSGLGFLRLEANGATAQRTLEMRSHCESQGGFLTILEAAIAVKQQIDVWGYSGNALNLMRSIKQQFDADNILSPHRFVGGI